MRDDQLNRQGMRPAPTFNMKPTPSMKQLSWGEIKTRHIMGLYFNFDEKFTPRHKCKGPQLLLLEGVGESLLA